jgi:hypothetical protein
MDRRAFPVLLIALSMSLRIQKTADSQPVLLDLETTLDRARRELREEWKSAAARVGLREQYISFSEARFAARRATSRFVHDVVPANVEQLTQAVSAVVSWISVASEKIIELPINLDLPPSVYEQAKIQYEQTLVQPSLFYSFVSFIQGEFSGREIFRISRFSDVSFVILQAKVLMICSLVTREEELVKAMSLCPFWPICGILK